MASRRIQRIWKELRGARQTITMEMYYFEPGKIADTLSRILTERARSGVSVHLLDRCIRRAAHDAGVLDTLRAAGVHTAIFRPVHWYEMQKLQNRSHMRAVVVDGRVGFTGGFGIADKWLGNGHSKDQWRDTDVRFTVRRSSQLQATFAEGWVEATGRSADREKYFPQEPAKEEPAETAGLLDAQPTIGSTPAERFLALSIAGARHTLYITNSYFVPNHDFKQLLIEASKRGVDVRVLTVGPETDVKITRYAGRKQYDDLLEGGVRIFEFAPTMMHAKTLVADGVWCSIGTMNFDNRSMVFNNESNLNVLDPTTGASLDSVFLNDLRYSKEIKRAEFEKRGPYAAADGARCRRQWRGCCRRNVRPSFDRMPRRSAPAPLASFHPIVRAWFAERFGAPSEPQRDGVAGDRERRAHAHPRAHRDGQDARGVPLGAEPADRARHRGAAAERGADPLHLAAQGAQQRHPAQSRAAARRAAARASRRQGAAFPEIRVAVRTGDTPASARARMLRKAPHILITTPESLHIMLTSVRGRGMFGVVRAVIVDEIHAVAGTKRGAHLALTLERLELLARDTAAAHRTLGHAAAARRDRALSRRVATRRRRRTMRTGVPPGDDRRLRAREARWSCRWCSPVPDLGDVGGTSGRRWRSSCSRTSAQARTTLVFVNNRAQAERIAARVNALAGEELALPYHGSLVARAAAACSSGRSRRASSAR